jgi:hypothetical protein
LVLLDEELLELDDELPDDDSLELLLEEVALLLDKEELELELLEGTLELLLLEAPSGEVGPPPHPKRGPRPAIAAPPDRRIRNSRRSPSLSFRFRSCFERPASSSLNAMTASSPLTSSLGSAGGCTMRRLA